MKTERLIFRTTKEKADAYKAACASEGVTVSQVARAALDKLVKRVAKKESAE